MFRSIAVGLVLGLAATLSHAAAAMKLEAVWQIQLQDTQRDLVTNTDVALNIQSTGTVKTLLEVQPVSVTDYGAFTYTILWQGQNIILESDFQDDLIANPFPGTLTELSVITAESGDFPASYTEVVQIRSGFSAYDGDFTWLTEHAFVLTYTAAPKSGTGADDVAFTEEDFFDFLSAFMANPADFEASFLLTDLILEWDSASDSLIYHAGQQRSGTLTLVSLQKVDVPEPPAYALIGAGLLAAGLVHRKRRPEKAVHESNM